MAVPVAVFKVFFATATLSALNHTIHTIAFWLTKCQKSARYHIDIANSIVFTSKRLPPQPVSSKRNH